MPSPHPKRAWLEQLLQRILQYETLRPFQLDRSLDHVDRRDVFLVVAPGMGKTVAFLAPLLAAQEQRESGIAIIIVPMKFIAEQQV